MKNKYIALGLLALAGTLGLGACGGGSSTASSSEASVASSTETVSSTETATTETATTEEVVTSEETEVAPTRVKITQPDIVLVGSTLKISDICVFTPENATLYYLESNNEEVATTGDGVINIVGPGKAKVKVTVPNGEKTKTIGTINITAMSEEGKALQEYADSITNNYFIDATWSYYENNSWDKVTESDKFDETDPMGLVCNPNYVLDWVYGSYSALMIEADGNTYGYTLTDSTGAELPGESWTSAKAESAKATGVTLTERVDPAYLNLYFVIDGLLDITTWSEGVDDDGSVYFYTEDASTVTTTLGNMFGMNVTSYTGVYGEVSLSEAGTLDGTLRFDDSKDANECDFSIYVGDAAKVDALEEAVKTATPPAATDVSPIVTALAAYADNNYIVDWEIGLFDKQNLQPIEGYYDVNNIGTTLVDGDTIAYSSLGYTEEGAIDPESLDFGGIYTDTTNGGIYSLKADEDHLLAKDSDTPLTGSEEIKSSAQAQYALNLCPNAALTEDVLNAASLSLASEGNYLYTASFDTLALGYLLSGFCPFSYSDLFDDPSNAQYCEGYIGLTADGDINFYIVERVNIDKEAGLSGLQGVIGTIRDAGEAKVDLGDNLLDVFGFNVEEEGSSEAEAAS